MLDNISSISSEYIIINYIFNNFKYSNNIYNIINENDFFYEKTKKYFIEKKFFLKLNSIDEIYIFSNLKNLVEKTKKRKMIKILFNIVFNLLSENEIPISIYENIKLLLSFNSINKFKKLDYFEILKNYLFNKDIPIYTGYKILDNILNGLQKGDLIILAGRPSIGKTSFILNLIKNLLIFNNKIIIFSLEMSVLQIFIRLISIISEIKQIKFKNNDFSDYDIRKLSYLIKNFNFNNLIILDCTSLSPNDVEMQLNFYKKNNLIINIVCIDYIQLMKSEINNNNRVLEISDISRSLKLIAKNYNCVIIALSQLNRLIEYRNEKKPILSDLRDSGSLEQDADIVMFLNKKFKIIELNILKNRNGPLGSVFFNFENEYTKFNQI
ncbi:DnaB-like helicase C-terminal domain-containing protein [Candidatus Carsonella ruddii]|uniref:Putative replicative DNA helicase n=1 Tax=Candidatus Carsonella ruddii PC isolate NHV TaxID=1202540 RepID=J3TEP0_CARRU|nr:DnaB-like helicase C-terminal domain-containing protein [Candidatus Carsonella ruddii]AFP84282.1 putative replicative DNA helicase [Candidatus Carsonella ruddii PC isolate NHV]